MDGPDGAPWPAHPLGGGPGRSGGLPVSYRAKWRAGARLERARPITHTRRTGLRLDAQRPKKYKKVCPKNSDTPRE